MLEEDVKKTILSAQKNEITEHFIYEKLAKSMKDSHNKNILKDISSDELKHYNVWKEYTDEYVKPSKLKIWMYFLISRIFGVTFGIKLMERGEEKAQVIYKKIARALITGIAATLSMAASEYLATKSEETTLDPFKASFYTSSAYIVTVLFLIFPYLLFTKIYFSLGLTIFNAIIVITIFTFYISVAKDISFRKRFLEMALISLGIAALAFAIGYLVRVTLNIEV